MLDHAIRYAKTGWMVIPLHSAVDGDCTCGDPGCRSAGKHPRTRHGAKDGTTDIKTIRRWWKIWPDSNLGICTGPVSDLVVLDVDPRHGGDETLRQLEDEHGELVTVTALTGGGGSHLFFRWPVDEDRVPLELASGAHVLGQGLDVKGDGGYVVAAPSRHASGRDYAWEVSGHPDDQDPAELPAWILRRLLQQATRTPQTAYKGRKGKGGGKTTKDKRDRLERALRALGVEYDPDHHGEQRVRCPSPDHSDTNPSCDLNLDRGVWICRSCGKGGGVRALESMTGSEDLPPTEAEELGDDPEERREISDALAASGIDHDPRRRADQRIACPVCNGDARIRLGGGVRWNCRTGLCHRLYGGTGNGLLLALAGDRPPWQPVDLLPEEQDAFDLKTCSHRSVVLMTNKRVRNRKSGVGVDCGACPECRRRRVIDRYLEQCRTRIQEAAHVWGSDVPRKSWSRWRMAIKRLFNDPAILRLTVSADGAYIGVVTSEEIPAGIPKEIRESTKHCNGQRGKARLAFVQVVPQYVLGTGVQLEQKLGERLTNTENITAVEASQEPDARMVEVAKWVSVCAEYAASEHRKKRERVIAMPAGWKKDKKKSKSEWSPEGEGAEGIHAPREMIAALFSVLKKYGIRCFREGTNKLTCDTSHRLYGTAFIESGIKPFAYKKKNGTQLGPG